MRRRLDWDLTEEQSAGVKSTLDHADPTLRDAIATVHPLEYDEWAEQEERMHLERIARERRIRDAGMMALRAYHMQFSFEMGNHNHPVEECPLPLVAGILADFRG